MSRSDTNVKTENAEVSSLLDVHEYYEDVENVKFQKPGSTFGILEDSQEYPNPNLILPQPPSDADFDEEDVTTFDNFEPTQRGIQ